MKTFGCRVNQVETQAIVEKLSAAGHELCEDYLKADACILNTCTVTSRADSDVARFLRLLRSRNPCARLLVTGCYAQLNPEKVLALAPHAEIVSNPGKKDLPRLLGAAESASGWEVTGLQGRTRAFIKIQDGCDRFCAYCTVPYARPDRYSKPFEDLLRELKALVARGVREIVLSGINIGDYRCPSTGKSLADVLDAAARLDGEFRIRLSSIEAFSIDERLLDSACRAGDKFCRYFHIPLQTGSAAVARAMNRKCSPEDFARAVSLVRGRFSGAAVFSDVIAGYPTETEAEFLETRSFISGQRLCGLHVFSFSPRPGTAASKLKPLPSAAVRARAEDLRSLDSLLRAEFAKSLVGSVQRVLAEEGSRPFSGLAENFQRVLLPHGAEPGEFSLVLVKSVADGLCQGSLY